MDHNKLITAAAKKTLGPLGVRQQRKSRLWYDDHGWWAVVVEFQPSAWDRGSYLNVGLSWMFYEDSGWSFNIGYREDGFQSASDQQNFETAIAAVAGHAARRVMDYRDQFSSLDKMCAYYRTQDGRGEWPDYYAGILAGLSGDRHYAEQRFLAVVNAPSSTTWQRGLQFRCHDLIRLLEEPEFFRESVLGIVLRCRSARNLDEMPLDEIAIP
jgi:hypothetical protein